MCNWIYYKFRNDTFTLLLMHALSLSLFLSTVASKSVIILDPLYQTTTIAALYYDYCQSLSIKPLSNRLMNEAVIV